MRWPKARILNCVLNVGMGQIKLLPSFWCKRRGSLLIGASQLLITVCVLAGNEREKGKKGLLALASERRAA